jgi:membrane protease subunit HflC
MKTSRLNLVVGTLLLLLFLVLLFLFQVRQTEVAVVTTFGKATRPITEPGLYFKWPWPVQKVTKLDKRLQTLEGKFEETVTADQRNLLILVFAGWRIADPALFYSRFNGSIPEAERSLENIIRTAKNAAVGRHNFSHFISANTNELKFTEIEKEILDAVQADARVQGIQVELAGIKRLGLPESVTEKVFERMRAERTTEVENIKAQGTQEAIRIRSNADSKRDRLLAEADAEALRLRGEAEAEATRSYAVFEQNPELANLLHAYRTLEQLTRDRTTLIFDPHMPPFNLLLSPPDLPPVEGPVAVPPDSMPPPGAPSTSSPASVPSSH